MPSGGCECGAVRFEIEALRDTVTACHCSQCRRTSGHYWASTHGDWDQLKFLNQDGLTWYKSSDFAKRGFCKTCGSSLFYKMEKDDNGIAIAAGCLDDPHDLTLNKHIFVADKGSYYDLDDGIPKIDKW